MRDLARKIADASVRWLIERILESGRGVLWQWKEALERRRLKRRKGIYFQRKLRAMMAAYQAGEVPLAQVTASVQGWVNHVRYGNTVGLRKAVLGRL